MVYDLLISDLYYCAYPNICTLIYPISLWLPFAKVKSLLVSEEPISIMDLIQ